MSGRGAVLVADDDLATRLLFRELLERQGFDVHEAPDGAVAMDMLREHAVDLLITDVWMPGRSGVELLKRVRAEMPYIPVLIMTGRPEVNAAVECLKLGAVDYLQKPLDLERVVAVVEEALKTPQDDWQAATARRELQPAARPRSLAGYRLLRTLGKGTMGVVFLAEKMVAGAKERFAMKIIRPEVIESDDCTRNETIARFNREAELAADVDHPGIVKVVEHGAFGHDRVPYLVMEFAEGMTLRDLIGDGAAPDYRQGAAIIRRVADALAAIHVRGICHRDVKPQNIIIDGELGAKLTDFGIARTPDSVLTMTADVFGTPAYLAPEAFLSAKVDHRADIFSLGVVAYELFLGVRPFSGDSLAQLLYEIRMTPPTPPREIDGDFPLALQNIVLRMLKKRCEDRYQSAEEIVADLDAFIAGESRSGAAPDGEQTGSAHLRQEASCTARA